MFDVLDRHEVTSDTFTVVARADPFSEKLTEFKCHRGATIADVIALLPGNPLPHSVCIAWIGPHEIKHELFGVVRPNAGTTLYIKANLAIPAAAVAAYLGTSLLVANIIIAVATTLITTALSFLMNMLFAPTPPELKRYPNEPTVYNIKGARNRAQPFSGVPSILGKARFVPPYGAQPYTEIVGNDQYLRLLVVWGYGPCRVTGLQIGETAIDSFDDVEYETIVGDGTPGDVATLYPAIVRQQELSVVLAISEEEPISDWFERTTPIETDEIGLTITWPNGLILITSSGDRVENSTTVEIEYRLTTAASGDPWTAWIDEDVAATTLQPLRKSWRTTVTRGQYDVRIRYTATSNYTTTRNEAVWTALRSFQNEDPIGLAGLSYTAIRIRATDQLNGIVETINAIVEREVPAYNGVDWSSDGYSRNPADIFRFVLTAPENVRALASSGIDDDSLADWWDFCDTQGFTYGHVIDFEISVWELLGQIAQAGRASAAVIDGKWGVVVDTTKSTVVQQFTPRNTWDYVGQRLWPDQPHAIRARFVNEARDYQTDERIVYDDGYDSSNASLFEAMELPGVQGADHAYRLVREFLAITRLRPEVHTFKVDMENLIATRGDRVTLNHDVPLIGTGFGRVSAVVIAGSNQTVTLDDEATITYGTTYSIRFRLADGTGVVRNVTTGPAFGTTATYTELDLDPMDADTTAPAVGDMYSFGPTDEETLDMIIHQIKPSGDLTAELVCYPYSPAIFDAATSIPAFVSKVSSVTTRVIGGPSNPVITDIVSDEDALVRTATGDVLPTIAVYFRPGVVDPAVDGFGVTATTHYRARWRETGTDRYTYGPTVDDVTPYSIPGVETGESYDIGIQAIDRSGATSAWTVVSNHIVSGSAAEPPTIDEFSLNTIGTYTYLSWAYPSIKVDVVGYELRYSPAQDVVDWSTMTPIASNIPRTATTFAIPTRNGSYAIKAIDVNGTRSLIALYVNAGNSDPAPDNILATITEDTVWGGTFTNTEEDTPVLRLLASSGGEYPALGYYEFAAVNDIGYVATVLLTADLTVATAAALGFMSEWTTLSGVASMSGGAVSDKASVEIQVAFSAQDTASPTVWSNWITFITGEYTGRNFKFRLVLRSSETYLTPTVSEAVVRISAPDSLASGEDIATGATVGYSVAFSPAFVALKSITIAPQDMATGDYYVITNKARTGFDITFYNSAASAIDRTFDFQALGYARVQGT